MMMRFLAMLLAALLALSTPVSALKMAVDASGVETEGDAEKILVQDGSGHSPFDFFEGVQSRSSDSLRSLQQFTDGTLLNDVVVIAIVCAFGSACLVAVLFNMKSDPYDDAPRSVKK